ncbi:TolC family protein [Sulfurimonas sp.]
MKRKFLISLIVVTSLYSSELKLEDAITIALQNNKKHTISMQDRAIAKARFEQASSANYPTLDLTLVANRHDQKFIDHTETTFDLSALGIPQPLPISYDHTVMGRDTAFAEAKAQYVLYSGGKISAAQEMAKQGLKYSQEASQLTDTQIVTNIKKYYAGAVLAQRLEFLTHQTVERIKAIYTLTQRFYQDGSLKVKKTDFLRTKIMLSTVESMLEDMKTNKELAFCALNFEMGMEQNNTYTLAKNDLLPNLQDISLQSYYETMYLNNHLLAQTDIALKVSKAKINDAQSGYLPSIVLYGKIKALGNDQDGGIINATNDKSWDVGLALNYNLFSGGATHYKIEEAKANQLKLQAQKAYVKSALNMQLNQAYSKMKKSLKQYYLLKGATEVAKENSNLNMRAYQHDMVETKDVLEAQIFESLTKASFYKSLYEAQINKAELDYLIAKSL